MASVDPPPIAAYLTTILSELSSEHTALLVIARGLGLHRILQRLCLEYHKPERLVFLLNTTQDEERQLLHGLSTAAPAARPPAVLNNECTAQERVELYLAGGVILVTARILIVDLLCHRVPVEMAHGLIVANAHRVTDSSNIGFILRIFRQHNKGAFIKALSDDAHAFTRGFAKVEKVMRTLRVRSLQLWPRFRREVSAVLDQCQPHVEELSVPLTPRGGRLQHALLEAVDECLKELRGLNQSVDVSQLTVENSLFKSFDTIVRMQLDPVWHRIGKRTKALVADLQTLRKLLNFLVAFDCVTYFEYLETVFDAASALHPAERPHWILSCSEAVWQLARDRVYELQRTQQVLALAPTAAPGSSIDAAAAREKQEAAETHEREGDEDDDASGAPKRQRVDGAQGAASAAAPAPKPTLGLSSSIAPVSGAKQAPPLSVRCVLEESPKWAAFRELLTEIRAQQEAGGVGRTLIVVRDERTGVMVRELIAHGAKPLLEATFVRWVSRRRRGQAEVSTVLSSRQHEARLLRAAADGVAERHAQKPAPPPALPSVEQHDSATAAVGAGPLQAAPLRGGASTDATYNVGGAGASAGAGQRMAGKGRTSGHGAGRRGMGAGGRSAGGRRGRGAGGASAAADAGELGVQMKWSGTGSGEAPSTGSGGGGADSATAGGGDQAGPPVDTASGLGSGGDDETDASSTAASFSPVGDPADGLLMCTHAAVASEVLEETTPRYVILYDADPGFVRAIELAQATMGRGAFRMRVYFLMQQDSVEEQRYRSALRIEREAFQSLIVDKSRLVIPEHWDDAMPVPRLPGEAACTSGGGDGSFSNNIASRRGGGRAAAAATRQPSVIVDVREFRSALPNMLHLHGMEVKPITLEIGDYILSPEVCVERKAIPDLVQSLSSGRLFNQAEAMMRYYKRPALLIECEDHRPFGLINANELGPEIAPQSLLSKLSLLLLHFPKMRLLWSRSPAHTVAIFSALKQGQSEPDAAVAASVGAPHVRDAGQVFNMAPQDFLRQLPGVHAHNYRKLMNSVPNLEALARKTRDELAALIGAQNARLLHDFLHRTS